ncbi:DUF2937 family protein [Aurantimonas sp. A2-1-M11]|uniref:DUF2937 family protein n=1 Tax=Aurantimonas sp. A2-1-M11 TaxID=3113712 RepID=UPI002F94C3B8
MPGLVIRVVAALFLGLVSSQSLEFTQQYLQRLGGAADELRRIVERFDASAAASDLSRGEAVERLRENRDAFVARQGTDAGQTIARFDDVKRRYRMVAESAPLFRPFVAVGDPDWEIAERAAADYRPALPITVEGLLLAVVGFGLGWAIGAGGHGAVRMRRRRRERRLPQG